MCKKVKCVEEVAEMERTSYYVNNLVPNVAIMHGLLRGVRVLVIMFDKLLSGGRLENEMLTEFLCVHLTQVACVIRDADPWFVQMNGIFKEIAGEFSTQVKNGVHIEPDFLRAVNEYASKEMKIVNMQ